jgi:membrane-bound lytic murein transglycosylase MltF
MNIHNWLKQSKKELIYLLILIAFLIIFAKALHTNVPEPQEEVENYDEIVVLIEQSQEEYLYDNMKMYNVKIASLDYPVETETTDLVDGFTYREDIPLSEEVQRYAHLRTEEEGFPITLIYGIMKLESNFDKQAYSHTNDSGLLQIHGRTGRWIAEELEMDDYDLYDPKTNIDFSLWYLSYLRDYWDGQDVSEEDKAFLIVLGYNRGLQGSIDWVRKHGWHNAYVDKVFEYKMMYERGE